MTLTESIVEYAALKWFGEQGYPVRHGLHLAPGERAMERETLRKVLRVETPERAQTNRTFDRKQRDGSFRFEPDSFH